MVIVKTHYIMKKLLVLVVTSIAMALACQKAPENVPITSVSLNQQTAEMEVGETVQLKATVLPAEATDKSVIWASSNKSVAMVENGTVVAIAEGSTTITASSGGKSATCAVTVKKKTVDVTSVELNKTEIALVEGDSETLTATVKPDDASDKTVTWSSSDSSIAKVEDGKVTAVKEGDVTITAKAGEKSAMCKVSVSKKVIPVESIELNKTTLVLVEGDSETLTATVKPDDATDKTVSWSTSDASIATVKNGLITAIKEGIATISVTSGEASANCEVKVITPMDVVISFADSGIKSCLVNAFDTNNDGELSFREAAAVTSSVDIMNSFGEKNYFTSFDEFQYFSSVTSITASMFSDWSQLTLISLPNSINYIGASAFSNCSRLESISIPEGITCIPSYCFYSCKKLSTILLPNSLLSISDGAFKEAGLTEIVIPDGVESIGSAAFYYCKQLKTISLSNSITSIGAMAFDNCAFQSIVLPEGLSNVGHSAFHSCESLTSITIPSSLTVIAQETFWNCKSLKTVVLSEGITEIGIGAFKSCIRLSSLNIPQTITRIRNDAFRGSESIEFIVVRATSVPTGGMNMFSYANNCPIYVPAVSVEDYKVANNWRDYADRIQAIQE